MWSHGPRVSVLLPTDSDLQYILHTHYEDTHTVVDKVGDVALVSCIHCIHVLHIVQVKEVCGSLAVIHLTPPLCFICCDDLL